MRKSWLRRPQITYDDAHARLRVVVGDLRAPQPRLPHRVRHVADLHVGESPQPERVHAEDRTRELVRHVAVHPLDHRDDRDEEHHADVHADDGEDALQLLRPDGLEGEAERFEEGHGFTLAAYSYRSASTGSSRAARMAG